MGAGLLCRDWDLESICLGKNRFLPKLSIRNWSSELAEDTWASMNSSNNMAKLRWWRCSNRTLQLWRKEQHKCQPRLLASQMWKRCLNKLSTKLPLKLTDNQLWSDPEVQREYLALILEKVSQLLESESRMLLMDTLNLKFIKDLLLALIFHCKQKHTVEAKHQNLQQNWDRIMTFKCLKVTFIQNHQVLQRPQMQEDRLLASKRKKHSRELGQIQLTPHQTATQKGWVSSWKLSSLNQFEKHHQCHQPNHRNSKVRQLQRRTKAQIKNGYRFNEKILIFGKNRIFTISSFKIKCWSVLTFMHSLMGSLLPTPT